MAAILQKHEQLGQISQLSPIKETEGLSQHEIVALVSVMQNSFINEEGSSAWQIKDDLNKAGFTDIAIGLAMRSLKRKGLILSDTGPDRNGDPYTAYRVTGLGEDWLLANQDKLVLRRDLGNLGQGASDDDVPF